MSNSTTISDFNWTGAGLNRQQPHGAAGHGQDSQANANGQSSHPQKQYASASHGMTGDQNYSNGREIGGQLSETSATPLKLTQNGKVWSVAEMHQEYEKVRSSLPRTRDTSSVTPWSATSVQTPRFLQELPAEPVRQVRSDDQSSAPVKEEMLAEVQDEDREAELLHSGYTNTQPQYPSLSSLATLTTPGSVQTTFGATTMGYRSTSSNSQHISQSGLYEDLYRSSPRPQLSGGPLSNVLRDSPQPTYPKWGESIIAPGTPTTPVATPSMPPGLRSAVPSESIQWVYLDPQGMLQGPFPGESMHLWYIGDFLKDDLYLRRLQDPDFIQLGELKQRIKSTQPFSVNLPEETWQLALGLGQPSLTAPQVPETEQFNSGFTESHRQDPSPIQSRAVPQTSTSWGQQSNAWGAVGNRIASRESSVSAIGSIGEAKLCSPAPGPIAPIAAKVIPTKTETKEKVEDGGKQTGTGINSEIAAPLENLKLDDDHELVEDRRAVPVAGQESVKDVWDEFAQPDSTQEGDISVSSFATPAVDHSFRSYEIEEPPLDAWAEPEEESLVDFGQPQTPSTIAKPQSQTNAATSVAEAPMPEHAPWAKQPPRKSTPSIAIKELRERQATKALDQRQATAEKSRMTATDAASTESGFAAVAPLPQFPPTSEQVPKWVTGFARSPKKSIAEIQREQSQANASSANETKSKAQRGGWGGAGYHEVIKAAPGNAKPTFALLERSPSPASGSAAASPWGAVPKKTQAKSPGASELGGSTLAQGPAPTLAARGPGPRTAPAAAGTFVPKPAAKQLAQPAKAAKPASVTDELVYWSKSTLEKGLAKDVDLDEVLELFLSLPANSDAKEFIADSIYSYSSSIDGRRFAHEFLQRKPAADAALKPNESWKDVLARSNPDIEMDPSFKVVTKRRMRSIARPGV